VAAHEKTVRLAPPLAKEIAALAVKTVSIRECVKIVNLVGEVVLTKGRRSARFVPVGVDQTQAKRCPWR
jgi:hypothetical protein